MSAHKQVLWCGVCREGWCRSDHHLAACQTGSPGMMGTCGQAPVGTSIDEIVRHVLSTPRFRRLKDDFSIGDAELRKSKMEDQ
jgi:hypothetical protein